MISLQTNDFELFDVPAQFAQDRAQLDARWKALQREAHPDRFAAEGAAAQRIAMQWSVRINEAYQRLKDPLKRAAYLCELQGAPVQAENNTAMPSASACRPHKPFRDPGLVGQLLHQISYFTNGAVIGTRSFVESMALHHQHWLQRKRQPSPHPVSNLETHSLFSLRPSRILAARG